MGWLEDTLASIAASGEGAVNLGPQLTEREREMMAIVKGGGYGVPDVTNPGIRMAMGDGPMPYASGSLPFSIGGDPMIAGGVPGNGPGLPFAPGGDPMVAGGAMRNGPGLPFAPGTDPMTAGGPPPFNFDPMTAGTPNGISLDEQAARRLRAGNPALSFPTSQPTEKYIDYASGFPIEMTRLVRPIGEFGDSPGGPPRPPEPPAMPAQAGLPGLNSPFGGGGAPFSIAGSPSLVAAKEMVAPPPPAPPPGGPPPPMTQQAAIPGLVPPGAAPGVPAPALVAQGGDGGDGDTPAAAPTDASARRRDVAPAAAAAATAAAIPAIARPAATSFLERLGEGLNKHGPMLMALGAGMAGAPSFGEGISRGLAAATPYGAARQKETEALALQAQHANVTARLLASKGATPQEIAAAVAGGPDVMKALVGQYLGKDKFSVVQAGEDKYGGKTFKVFNTNDGTFKEVPAGSAAEAKDIAQRQELEGVTGADRLTALKASDPAYARKVQSAVNGDISLPTGRAALSPAGRKFIEDVLGVDGTVSEADFKIRQQVRKNYTSGKDFQVTKSINTVVDHGQQLEKAIKDLGNFNYFSGVMNPARDAVLSQTDPKYIAAKHSYNVNAEGFAREMDFALSGGRPTVSGAEHQRKAFDMLAAQVGQDAALKKSIEMLDARLHEHQRGYEEALPPGTKDVIVPRLEKKTTDFIDRLVGRGAPGAALGSPVKPGNYVYRNGVLVPE